MNYEKMFAEFLSENIQEYCGIEYLNGIEFLEFVNRIKEILSKDDLCYIVTDWSSKGIWAIQKESCYNFIDLYDTIAIVTIGKDAINHTGNLPVTILNPLKSFSVTKEQFINGEINL